MRKWLLLAFALVLFGCDGEAVRNAGDGSVKQVSAYLKKTLKDPDSFEAIEWNPVMISGSHLYRYTVVCKYRAKNSFGGYVIDESVFYLDSLGNVLDQQSISSN